MVTKDTIISELIKDKPESMEVLMESGMQCAACHLAEGETVAEAAAEHGLDPVMLIRKLNFRIYGRLA